MASSASRTLTPAHRAGTVVLPRCWVNNAGGGPFKEEGAGASFPPPSLSGPEPPPLCTGRQAGRQARKERDQQPAMLRLGRPCVLRALLLRPGRAWLQGSGCSAASTEANLQVEPGSGGSTFGVPPKDARLLMLLPKRAEAQIGIRSYSTGTRKETSTSLGNDHADPSQEDGKKPNKSQQLKVVFKEYGAVAVAFHVGISLMSLGMFYLAVSSGVDMTAILFKLGFDEALVQSKLAAGTSTFLLAYAVHKLFAPVRISITLVSVPFLVRYFRKIGFFKPPAANP